MVLIFGVVVIGKGDGYSSLLACVGFGDPGFKRVKIGEHLAHGEFASHLQMDALKRPDHFTEALERT